jgi:hypothetical protein
LIRFALTAASLVCAATGARAQIPDLTATPHQLRTMSPAQLGSLIFGAEAPAFTDSWVEGPTQHWKAISVNLATTPAPTGYSGLCAVTIGSAYFDWTIGESHEDRPSPLIATPFTHHAFILTSDDPGLEPGDDGYCGRRRPLSESVMAPTILYVVYPGSPQSLPGPDAGAARFGLLALIAARKAAGQMKVAAERCTTGFTDIPAACGDPAAFVSRFYMRQVMGVRIAPCPNAKTLCVDGAITGLNGEGVDHVIVATGETSFAGNAGPTVRSITVRAGSDPVYD